MASLPHRRGVTGSVRFDGGRDGDRDLAVITGGAGMERQERVPVEIGWDGFLCGGMGADEFLLMLEDRFDNSISKVVGNIAMDYDKVVKAKGVVILAQGRIGSRRDQRRGEFREAGPEERDLLR
jgi:hypothetical protein